MARSKLTYRGVRRNEARLERFFEKLLYIRQRCFTISDVMVVAFSHPLWSGYHVTGKPRH
jgi:hypothetical protein